MALASRFEPDPGYGKGIYRRRIDLRASDGVVDVDLIDDYHRMACQLRHDGRVIISLSGRIDRAPFSTCSAAPLVLKDLTGMPLASDEGAIYDSGVARRNCTHLFDMATLAIGLAHRGDHHRRFDLVVPDETDEEMTVEAHVDESLAHRWVLHDEAILSPAELGGRSLFGGFVGWARERFSGIALDAALHLRKAVFVARGRRYRITDPLGSIRDEPERLGACYTFSEPRFSVAMQSDDYVRDFTAGMPQRS